MNRFMVERMDILSYAEENKETVESTEENMNNINENSADETSNDKEVNEQTVDQTDDLLKKSQEECEMYKDKFQRIAAEFDNFKKRTLKEKEKLYQDAASDVVVNFLPVMDNFLRALDAIDTSDNKSFCDGVVMVAKQLENVFKDLGVEKIEALGMEFDPNLHNAVAHVEDENIGENTIIEELQTGYKYKDKVIRYSMVKVAN